MWGVGTGPPKVPSSLFPRGDLHMINSRCFLYHLPNNQHKNRHTHIFHFQSHRTMTCFVQGHIVSENILRN